MFSQAMNEKSSCAEAAGKSRELTTPVLQCCITFKSRYQGYPSHQAKRCRHEGLEGKASQENMPAPKAS